MKITAKIRVKSVCFYSYSPHDHDQTYEVALVTVGYAQLAVNSSMQHCRNSSTTTVAWRGGRGSLTIGEA